MQKRLTELLEYLDETRSRLHAAVQNVSPAVAELRPRDDAWSAAQIVAHLASVESAVAVLVEKSVKWARANGIGPETSDESILRLLDVSGVATSRSKIESPELLKPPIDARLDVALEALTTSRRALKEALAKGDGLDLSVVKRPHRTLGELNLYEWGLFIGQHEERHTRQMKETIDAVCVDAVQTVPAV
jgi:DinB family protein